MDQALRRLALILAAIAVDDAVSLLVHHSWAVMLPVGAVLSAVVVAADWYLGRRRSRDR